MNVNAKDKEATKITAQVTHVGNSGTEGEEDGTMVGVADRLGVTEGVIVEDDEGDGVACGCSDAKFERLSSSMRG